MNKISGWESYYKDGEGFLNTVVKNSKKQIRFTPVIIYNIVCMASEKFLMAYLMSQGRLPDNHTMADFAAAIVTNDEESEEIQNWLKYLNDFQQICSIAAYQRKDPDETDVSRIITASLSIKKFVDKRISMAAKDNDDEKNTNT